MMRRFLAVALFGLASLSSCALLTPNTPGFDQHGATIQVTSAAVKVSAGDWDVWGGTVTIYGADLRVNEPTCRAVDLHLECELPKFPAGRNYVLPLSGSQVVADAVVLRPDGRAYIARRIN